MKTYWVEKGRLMAGEYPGSFSTLEARTNLRWLMKNGITSFVDLTQEGDGNLPGYSILLDEEAGIYERGVKYRRFPIRDFDVPSIVEMKQILRWIKAGITDGDCMYVHCFGGKGRTGTVIGCYLVEQGFTGDSAINQIAVLRGEPLDGRLVSPETEAQRSMVFGWLESLE
jgi:protein tyrosine/serine phosphatase